MSEHVPFSQNHRVWDGDPFAHYYEKQDKQVITEQISRTALNQMVDVVHPEE